ncbi:hypothetical protein, partial [Ralstonia solanacearum]|uniref:hypothetical protein n=1 Tax=Ralstonia solanacearum TaxID=305 RepID=UPI001E384056
MLDLREQQILQQIHRVEPNTALVDGLEDLQGASLSAFLWARRLEKSLPARHREAVAEQDSKLVHGRFP